MPVTVDASDKNETTRVIKVTIPAEEVEQLFVTVTDHVRNEAALPGFRKGKVPLAMVAQKFSRQIREEVLDRLLSSSYRDALTQTRSVPIQKPKFENLVLDRGKPLSYQFTVDILPKAKVANFQGLKLKKKKSQATDAQVLEVLENLRQKNAVLAGVTGRPAAVGDVVTLDFEGRHDGKPVPGMSAKAYVMELGSHQTIPDFENALPGMNAGEEKTFTATFPKDYQAQDWAGKTVEFTASVKGIQEKKLGALDDGFAKEMGAFGSLEELKARVRQDLESEQNRQSQLLLRDQVTQHLGKTTQVKVPEVLIERSLEKLVRDQERRLQESGKRWEESGLSAEEFKKKNRDNVEFQLKAHLGLLEIAHSAAIQVGPDEIQHEVERMARLMRQTPQAISEYLNKTNGWDEIHDRLRDDKVLDHIIAQAKISES